MLADGEWADAVVIDQLTDSRGRVSQADPTAVYLHYDETHLYVAARCDDARPGRIKQILAVGVPLAERSHADHAATFKALHDRLWDLIRDEAAVADREVSHV